MKLAIYNGSPRRKKSNSRLLIDQFLIGYYNVCSEHVSVHYIAERKQKENLIDTFINAEAVIIIFPLYTDSMPGIVKEFFESLIIQNKLNNKKIGFIVQSGFPEAIHSVFVERYLEKLTKRLKCEYMGTIIKGGVEGIQVMPPWMTNKLFKKIQQLGRYFAENRTFSPKIKEELGKPYKMSSIRRIGFHMMQKTGLTNYYWNSNLKKNGALKNSFDRPFIEERRPT